MLLIIVQTLRQAEVNPIEHKTQHIAIVKIFFGSVIFLLFPFIYKNIGKKNAIITTQNPPNREINSETSVYSAPIIAVTIVKGIVT